MERNTLTVAILVYVIFLVWDAFEFFVIYFTFVETKGLTLEEIDEIFHQPNPRKYSTSHKFRVSPIRENADVELQGS